MGEPARRGAVIRFAAPAFLLAGALAALVPLALHLIRRRPPSRAPLPTARFLSPDARTSVRVSRPTDLPLLALRMLLLLLAGAALARPAWLPAPEGTSEIVLLDRGWPMQAGGAWPRAVEEARRTLLGPDGPRGELVLFDQEPVRVPRRELTPAFFDSLAVDPDATSDLAAAMRGLRLAARELRGADSVRVTLLSDLRSGAWTPGVAPLRRAAWPGSIAVPSLPSETPEGVLRVEPAPLRDAVVVAPADRGGYVGAALAATGWSVRTVRPTDAIPADASLYVFLAPPASPPSLPFAGADGSGSDGATVIGDAAGGLSFLRGGSPWTGGGSIDREAGGAMRIDDGIEVAGASGRAAGAPADRARVVAAWDDGRPAAAAIPRDRGCIVFVATELEGGDLPLSAAYPRALDGLARACGGDRDLRDLLRPLDAGARAVLRGRGPAVLAASALTGTGGGVQLGRWIWLAALIVASIETLIAYRRRGAFRPMRSDRGSDGGAGGGSRSRTAEPAAAATRSLPSEAAR